MNQLKVWTAVMAFVACALYTTAARSDDALEGLDDTMIVVEDSNELESSISEMRLPDDDDIQDDDWDDEERDDESKAHESDHDDDDFYRDNEKEDGLYGDEEDLDDGDEVDDDLVEEDD
jgi:hypothetical protein